MHGIEYRREMHSDGDALVMVLVVVHAVALGRTSISVSSHFGMTIDRVDASWLKIKRKKCLWCNRKLHAIEKLKSHSSWNCHFIYFMTWYRLFFLLFLSFALVCSLVPFARLHIVSYLMSNSRFKHTIASTQPQRTGWKSRAQVHTHRWTLVLLLKKWREDKK